VAVQRCGTLGHEVVSVRIGLQIPDFNGAGGAERLGSQLAAVARTADDAGFDSIGVMDHFFQIGIIGPPEQDMLEAYTTLGYLAACTWAWS
jgi:alkanesulfonate monooxygenase SsuD/methylene tetrahydromethanopterin reductase-like flavin-dependent oxidoreductase (luciferase family)